MNRRYHGLGIPVLLVGVLLAPVAYSSAQTASRLVYAQGGDVRTLDPSIERGVTAASVNWNITDGFAIPDPRTLEPKPHLATEWKAITPTTWRIRLRRGVTFHNGEPFDAGAAKFSLESVLDPRNRSDHRTLLSDVTRIDIVDRYTILIHTSKPMPLLPKILTLVFAVPPQLISEIGRAKFAQNPVGTGPYRFVKRSPDEYIRLEANADYWKGKPVIDQLEIRIIPDASARVAALLAGDVDVAENIPLIQAGRVDVATHTSVKRVIGPRTAYLQLVVTSAGRVGPGNRALQDRRVRQAIAHAVNIDAIVKRLLRGFVVRTKTIYNPLYFSKSLPVKVYEYDPAEARRLLQAAGYGNGFPFVIAYAPGTYLQDKEVAEAIAGYLREVGIDARLEPYERATWVDGYLNSKIAADAHFVHVVGTPADASGLVYARFRQGQLGAYYWTDELNRLADQIMTEVNSAQREKYLAEVATLVHQEVPMVPMYALANVYGVRDSVIWEPRSDGVFMAVSVRPNK